MKKAVLILLIFISIKTFSQEHWEDNFWQEEGKIRYTKTMTMAGLYTAFYSNGQIKWQGKCLENGTPDSIWVYFNQDGKKLWEGEFTGKYYEYKENYEYDENGNSHWDTSIIGHYKNGLKDGEWLEYNYSGQFINKKGTYLNGKPTGIWQEFQEEKIVTELRKSAEYNFSTQTKTLYKNDSIDGTEHIDSIDYASRYCIIGNEYNTNYDDDVKLNLCLIGSGQFFNLAPLNSYFSQESYRKLSSPVQSIGFEWSGISENVYWSYNINWTPAISEQLNDSIRLRLSGFNSTLSVGWDLIKADAVDIAPTLGIGFQQLKLKVLKIKNPDSSAYSFHEGDYRVYRNPSPTLNAMLNLRINMGSFSLGFAGGYILDCSSPKWRYNGKFLSDSPKTSVSGLVANISIGIHIKDY